jgi:hypothetical protein
MKGASLILLTVFFLGFSVTGFASEVSLELEDGKVITLSSIQLEAIAHDLEFEASTQDTETQKSLLKVSEAFQELSDEIKSDKKRRSVSFKSIMRGAGKGSTFISTTLLRPFVSIASFFTGFFEKPGKNQDSKAFLEFFLNHEDKLSDAWKNTGSLSTFSENLSLRVEDILLEKQIIIIQDLFKHYTKVDVPRDSVLKSLGIGNYEQNLEVKTLQEIAFDALGPELMFFEIDVNLINDHPEYQELKGFVGNISGDDLDSIMAFRPEFDLLDLGNRSRLKLHEGLIAFSSKIFVPKIVIGLVSKSIATAVTGVTLVADLGAIASTLVCTINKKVQIKLENKDPQLVDFCSYVVNKSIYVLSRSRARGYVKGKNFRRKVIKGSERARRALRFKKKKKKSEVN